MDSGRIVAVWVERLGSSVAVDAPEGTQVIPVWFTADFDEDGGQLLHQPTSEVFAYASADVDGETITLASPLPTGKSFAVGDALYVHPLADDFYANVLLDDAEDDEEPIVARVPHTLRATLPEGVRDPVGEAVRVDTAGEEWVVRDVVGSQPVIDGTYMDPETVPPTRDGVPPESSPTPTVQGGIGSLFVKWDGVPNNDPVMYEVHLSVTSGFTASASTLATETGGTLASLRTLPDGSPLAYDTDYFVRVVAKDLDGAAVQSAQASGRLVKVNSPDIAVNAVIAELIAAGSVTAEKLEAVMVLANSLVAGSETSGRVEVGLGTGAMAHMVGIHAIAPDGETITFQVDATTGEVLVNGRLLFGSGSSIESDYVELAEQQPPTPGLRQSRFGATSGGAVTSVAASWVTDTAPGNLLLAYVCAENSTFQPPPPTFTPPAGWTLVTSVTRDTLRLSLYQIPDAVSRSGPETFTFDVASFATIGLFEYEGMAAVPLDQVASASGASDTISTGTTPVTTQADELWFAVVGEDVGNPYLEPSNSFMSLGSAEGSDQTSSRAAHRIVTAVGAASTSWVQSFGLTPDWVGLVATFKAGTTVGDPLPTSLDKVRLYAKERGGETEVFSINSGGVVRVMGNDAVFLDEIEFDGTAAGVTFTNIDQNYRDLAIVMRVNRTNDTADFRDLIVRFNGDAGLNYDSYLHRQNESGTTSDADFSAADALRLGTVGNSTGNCDIAVHGYSRSGIKVTRAFGYAQDATRKILATAGGRYNLSDPVTSVEVALSVGDFGSGSGVQIWGVGKLV